MSDTESPAPHPLYADIPAPEIGAPLIFFDGASCHGTINGIIQIEVVARILVPRGDGGIDFKAISTGRLRCSLAAAESLRSSLEKALQMAAQPQENPAAGATLN